MLYIRTDGNPEIGTGHTMRCLSIAGAVEKKGGKVTFIVADDSASTMITERGYHVICLDSIWKDLSAEVESMISAIIENSIGKLLIDSYFVTTEYLQKLCELTQVIYIDDVNAIHYPCNMLINYNCYAEKFHYPARYPDTTLLLGCQVCAAERRVSRFTAKGSKRECKGCSDYGRRD
jgi:spore coat polysaccharide biosynthesis predicted glycosyltransferase SpsG